MKKLKKSISIKDKIISCVVAVLICLGIVITLIMAAANFSVVNTTMLDAMQPMAIVASQNISSNLHQLSEQMYRISADSVLTDSLMTGDKEAVKQFLSDRENEIEFVWLGIYHVDGSIYIGDDNAPSQIKN